jgi:hypothetical protein
VALQEILQGSLRKEREREDLMKHMRFLESEINRKAAEKVN